MPFDCAFVFFCFFPLLRPACSWKMPVCANMNQNVNGQGQAHTRARTHTQLVVICVLGHKKIFVRHPPLHFPGRMGVSEKASWIQTFPRLAIRVLAGYFTPELWPVL